jgi:methyl-accepting chemotaxis protein
MMLLTLYISHRIAGLFSGSRKLCGGSEGDYTVRLTLRKDDSFHDVAEEFNDMVSHIQNKG